MGEFLSGPWGIALTIGVTAAGALITSLIDTESEADKAKKALDTITDAVKVMGSAIDQSTGKLDEFNAKAALAARNQAAATRPQLAASIQKGSADILGEAQSAQTKAGALFLGTAVVAQGSDSAYNRWPRS